MKIIVSLFLALAAVSLAGAQTRVAVYPGTITVPAGGTQVYYTNVPVTYHLTGVGVLCSTYPFGGGTGVLFIAPNVVPGLVVDTLMATSVADPNQKTGVGIVIEAESSRTADSAADLLRNRPRRTGREDAHQPDNLTITTC